MNASRLKVRDHVMIESRRVETEGIDGQRGRVTGLDNVSATVECKELIESFVFRVRLDELVHLKVGE